MEKLIILGHENPDVDSIVSGYILEKILIKKGYFAEFIIPDKSINKDTLDICNRNGLNPLNFMKNIDFEDKNVKYILVDHNQRDLAGEVVCIIDHHPANTQIKTEHYYNKKISSTACFICQGNENLLDESSIKLAIIATLVDTASFHSTKGRAEDNAWAIGMCKKYNLDYNELAKEGLTLTPLDNIAVASLNGLKKYNFNGKKVESSYIQVEISEYTEDKIRQIIHSLKQYISNNKLTAFVFIVHDMKKFETTYYLITENNIISKNYPRYTQRGDTIMPEVEKLLK